MAVPDTDTVSHLFVERQPAWEDGCAVTQALPSSVFKSRSGLEQRTGRAHRSRWSMKYVAVLDRSDARARLLRAAAEMRAPLIVPFWPFTAVTLGILTADSVQVSRPATPDFFAPGDWVYFFGDDAAEFRQIETSDDAGNLTLATVADPVEFPTGTRAFPCRECTRQGDAETTHTSDESTEETLAFHTL